ncbi:hypothetical protein [Nocardiopsis sp. NPDC006938]|uniref:hypothetical protein n=1 Tax=Nocardiopsis sp. NPDC006938 TaxID=3364337 RepID=UPI003674E82D
MEIQPAHFHQFVGSTDVSTVEMNLRGGSVTAVYRPVEEQQALRTAGEALGPRLGVYEFLQALPLGEWVPINTLSDRERRILPAVPTWARRRRSGQLLRLADRPVRLGLLVTVGADWLDSLERACVLSLGAPRMAVCSGLSGDRERAVWEADYRGVGLAEHRDGELRVLVSPRTTVPESLASLRWRMAERVFAASQGKFKTQNPPRIAAPAEV